MKQIIFVITLAAFLLPIALLAQTHNIQGVWFNGEKTRRSKSTRPPPATMQAGSSG